MIRLIKFIIFIAILLGGAFVYFNYIASPSLLSADQEEIRGLYGPPEQFMITYVPRGAIENPQMARQEVWYYPKQEKKVSFLAGDLIIADEFKPKEAAVSGTSLRPEDFDVYMGFDGVAALVGELNLQLMDMPVFSGEGVETYVSPQALFIFEDDYLTYVQTIGIGDN